MGKTTVSAALGVAASRLGIDTLLVEIEGKRGLASVFATDGLVYEDTVVEAADPARGTAALRARTIRPDTALLDYLQDHGLTRFAKRLSRLQVLDTLATSTPGLRDLIVMGKIKQLEVAGNAELIIVDAPASGHAISFLRAARGLQRTVDTGPIRRQADEVVAMLTDPERAQVLLVTLAEETPMNELVETAYALEDEVGILLGPAVINGLYPQLDLTTTVSRAPGLDPELAEEAAAAAAYWTKRAAGQASQIERLVDELPLEQLRLPLRFATRLDRHDIDELATVLTDEVASLKFEPVE